MPLCKIENREYKLEAILKIGCKFKFKVDTKQTSEISREGSCWVFHKESLGIDIVF